MQRWGTLNHLSAERRETASEELARIGIPAVEPLISFLERDSVCGKVEAAKAFGKLKDPRAIEPLIKCLKSHMAELRSEAARALCKITGKGFGENTLQWEKWFE